MTPDWIWTELVPPSAWLADCLLVRRHNRLWRIHQPSGSREELSAPRASKDSTDLWKTPIPQTEEAIEAEVPIHRADTLLSDGTMDLVRFLLDRMGDETFVYGKMGTPFWKCYPHLGFYGLMTLPRQQPGLMHRLLERMTRSLRALAQAYARVGVHGVFLEECLTSADLISPRMYDTLVVPYDQMVLDTFTERKTATILYVCGDIMSRLPQLAELAPTALAIEESKKGFDNNLEEVAAAVGHKLVLLGNLDATRIAEWDSTTLMERLESQLRGCRSAKGFVVSMGSPFPLDTRVEKVAALIAAARSPELRAAARRNRP